MEKTVIFGGIKKTGPEKRGGEAGRPGEAGPEKARMEKPSRRSPAVGNMHSPDVRSPRRNKNDTTTMTTELCAYSVDACLVASRAGVTRVELCASPWEGGTTPSAATIRLARRIPGIRLQVMIRPRGGDFCYSDPELEQMAGEIRFARSCGVDGVVLGVLTPDGEVDAVRTAALVSEAGGLEVTFHRAFDMTRDPLSALETVIGCGCRRILTSGGRNTAVEGIDTLRELVVRAAGRIEIMAGSGVNAANARLLADAGVDALHFSARGWRESRMRFRNPNVSMGGVGEVPEYATMCADETLVRKILKELE